MLTLGKKVDDPKAWNDEQAQWRSDAILQNIHPGCVSSWACEGCGHLIHDSICICSRAFTCPGCGYEEKPLWRDWEKSPANKESVMLEIEYDDNPEDIIDKVNKELQQLGIELQEREDED